MARADAHEGVWIGETFEFAWSRRGGRAGMTFSEDGLLFRRRGDAMAGQAPSVAKPLEGRPAHCWVRGRRGYDGQGGGDGGDSRRVGWERASPSSPQQPVVGCTGNGLLSLALSSRG